MANEDEWFPVLFCPEFRCADKNQLTTTLLLFQGTPCHENKSAKAHIHVQQQKHTDSDPVLVKIIMPV